MRTLSSAANSSTAAQETSVVWLILLEITHDDLGTPIRVANNTEDITSNGDTYVGFPFVVRLPEDSPDRPPVVELIIDNIDQTIINAVRELTSSPTVTLSVVTSSDYDTVEVGPIVFELKDVRYDALVIRGTLSFEPILDEPYPAPTFIPSDFPGLF